MTKNAHKDIKTKQLNIRVTKDNWYLLKYLAIHKNTTITALVDEAINDLFKKHNHPVQDLLKKYREKVEDEK